MKPFNVTIISLIVIFDKFYIAESSSVNKDQEEIDEQCLRDACTKESCSIFYWNNDVTKFCWIYTDQSEKYNFCPDCSTTKNIFNSHSLHHKESLNVITHYSQNMETEALSQESSHEAKLAVDGKKNTCYSSNINNSTKSFQWFMVNLEKQILIPIITISIDVIQLRDIKICILVNDEFSRDSNPCTSDNTVYGSNKYAKYNNDLLNDNTIPFSKIIMGQFLYLRNQNLDTLKICELEVKAALPSGPNEIITAAPAPTTTLVPRTTDNGITTSLTSVKNSSPTSEIDTTSSLTSDKNSSPTSEIDTTSSLTSDKNSSPTSEIDRTSSLTSDKNSSSTSEIEASLISDERTTSSHTHVANTTTHSSSITGKIKTTTKKDDSVKYGIGNSANIVFEKLEIEAFIYAKSVFLSLQLVSFYLSYFWF